MGKKEDHVSPQQHANALGRIRRLEDRVEQIVHSLATGVGVKVPDPDDEDAGNADHA